MITDNYYLKENLNTTENNNSYFNYFLSPAFFTGDFFRFCICYTKYTTFVAAVVSLVPAAPPVSFVYDRRVLLNRYAYTFPAANLRRKPIIVTTLIRPASRRNKLARVIPVWRIFKLETKNVSRSRPKIPVSQR